MKSLLFKKNNCSVYEVDEKYFVQFDSGSHGSMPMETEITKEQMLGLSGGWEEAGRVFGELDKSTFKKISADEWMK